MAFGEVCRSYGETRIGASTTPVPPFALFECLALQSGYAFRTNNAKSGTMPVEARSACRVGRALLSEVTKRIEDRFGGCFPAQAHYPRSEALRAEIFRTTKQ